MSDNTPQELTQSSVSEAVPKTEENSQQNSQQQSSAYIPVDYKDKKKVLNKFYTEILCANFFRFLLIIKMIHWQTDSFAIHKTTDELYSQMNELLDDLVETLQGEILASNDNQLGKVLINNDCKFFIEDQTNNGKPDNFIALLDRVQNFLSVEFEKQLNTVILKDRISSILNIRDEMLAAIQKARYLSSFK